MKINITIFTYLIPFPILFMVTFLIYLLNRER